jgi:hypothetical protein
LSPTPDGREKFIALLSKYKYELIIMPTRLNIIMRDLIVTELFSPCPLAPHGVKEGGARFR